MSPGRFAFARVQSTIAFTCFTVGISLGSLPLGVTRQLHYGDAMVGTVIGFQFVAALVSRAFIGRLLWRCRPRNVVTLGLLGTFVYGILILLVSAASKPMLGIAALLAARLVLGFSAGILTTAAIIWSTDILGDTAVARVLSTTGMCIYGAMALGAPVGIAVFKNFGLAGTGVTTAVMPVLAGIAVYGLTDIRHPARAKASLFAVFPKISLPGAVIFTYAAGFVAIESFVSLFFENGGWSLVILPLFLFGGSFVLVRVLFAEQLLGGNPYKFPLISLCAESVGLIGLAIAPTQHIALAFVVIAGAGCSFTFPSLGAISVSRCKLHERGTAIGLLSGFQDLSYGLAGPLIGAVVSALGYRAGFLIAGVTTMIGVLLFQIFVSRTHLMPD